MDFQTLIDQAAGRVLEDIQVLSPFMADALQQWMLRLSGTQRPSDYFTHPLAFPTLLIPWWFETSISGTADHRFQSTLIYSSISGYYFIRMIDNIMDGHAPQDAALLPSLSLLHSQFQTAYQQYFPDTAHPFWHDFSKYSAQSAEFAMRDAAHVTLDLESFRTIAGLKVCGGKIPLSAVAHHYGCVDKLDHWLTFFDAFGCWHQFLNDLLSWLKDIKHGTSSYFLSEGERRRLATETLMSWGIREGLAWGSQQLSGWLDDLYKLAEPLQSEPLIAYLELRGALLREQSERLRKGAAMLSQLERQLL